VVTPSAGGSPFAEVAGRWLATRTTRRGFLDKTAKTAVFVSIGATAATALATRAEARVCGQSGVAPRCATLDCEAPAFWGWCWYATGCCANGGLKKICDCCLANFPFVQGYCPDGTAVYCIVESCWADPRVQPNPVYGLFGASATHMASLMAVRRARGATGGLVYVLPDDALTAATIAPLAFAEGGAVVLTRADVLSPSAVGALQRLAPSAVRVVGGTLTDGVLGGLAGYGFAVERVELGGNAAARSVAAAQLIAARTQSAERVVVTDTTSVDRLVMASGLAVSRGGSVVIGGTGTVDANAADLALLAASAIAGGPRGSSITFGTLGAPANLAAVATGGPVVVSSAGVTPTTVFDALTSRPNPFTTGFVIADGLARPRIENVNAGRAGIDTELQHKLQGVLNRLDQHQLTGVAGEGLPVWIQPTAERPVGMARLDGIEGLVRSKGPVR
jgi:hypothetical protein